MLKFDEIGHWSEIKLKIIKEYASTYSRILSAQKNPALSHVYIDAFAGSGVHVSKKTGESVPGSPLNALHIDPAFDEYYLIDLDSDKIGLLREIVGNRTDVHIYEEDCNIVLLSKVFPRVLYKDYRRGLCLLDPYGLHLTWDVIRTASEMRTIDIFLNFPVADMNRNVLWRNPEGVDKADIERMNLFWGDSSWREVAYTTKRNLFGYMEKEDNKTIAEGFRERLLKVAGFKYVPQPLPMRNSQNSIIYYLFFASQKPVAQGIIEHIFNSYR
jgi:three-Cys-motif partner protein